MNELSDLTAAEQRRLANAVRQVIITAEHGPGEFADALSSHDTITDFKRLHAKLSPPIDQFAR